MSIPAIPFVQTNFSAGQISASAQRQDDVKFVRAGCRVMRNARPSPTGTAIQRLGRRAIFTDKARTETIRFTDELMFRISFGNQQMTLRGMDGTLIWTGQSLPWLLDRVDEIHYAVFDRDIIVTFPGTRPLVFHVADDGNATELDFEFRENAGGGLRQPYYRYAAAGITLLPSARTGTITIEFSDDALVAGHVGDRFRYVGREIEIVEVTSATEGVATVIEELPPTYRVTLDTASGFTAGQIAIGADSGAEGEVIAVNIGANTIDVVMSNTFAGYIDTEAVVSPTGRGEVTSSAAIDPGASVQWDEALMSDYRGWPRFVTVDQKRLIFADFPALMNGIAESAILLPNDFYPGADSVSAIFEFAPNNARVISVVGGADQFVFTDIGIYYIPISVSNPLVPGSVEFRLVSSIGAGSPRPVGVGSGVLYLNADLTRVCYLYQTGLTARPYDVKDMSELNGDLFADPYCLAATTGAGSAAERYVYIANGDGSLVVGRFNVVVSAGEEWMGWAPADTTLGEVRWVSAFGDEVTVNVAYPNENFGVDELWVVEVLDEDAYLDGQVPLNEDVVPLRPDPEDLSLGRLWVYSGGEVDVMQGVKYLGRRSVDLDGNLVEIEGDDFSAADVVAGRGWEATVEPFIPNLREDAKALGQRGRRRKIKRGHIAVIGSTGFTFMGRRIGAYEPQEDGGAAPELREQVYTFRQLGRQHDPRVAFVKDVPGPFELLEISGEVTV